MKLHVRDCCIGCGLCVALCPDLFVKKPDGKVKPATDENIPANAKTMIAEAKASCPAVAIFTTDNETE